MRKYITLVALLLLFALAGYGSSWLYRHSGHSSARQGAPPTALQQPAPSVRHPPQPFTIYRNVINVQPDGKEELYATEVEYHRADGGWKMERTYQSDHQVQEFVHLPGRGMIAIKRKAQVLQQRTDAPPDDFYDVSYRDWSHYPAYDRTEKILGLTAYVTKADDGDGGVSEQWHVPELGVVPIKVISKWGSGLTQRFEPTKIELGEPPASIFALPDWPVEKSDVPFSQ